MRAAALLLLLCAGARGEEIRIEIARGLTTARVESQGRTQVLRGPARFDGPVRLEGRRLPGSLELFADGGKLVAVNVVDLEQYVAAMVGSRAIGGADGRAAAGGAIARRGERRERFRADFQRAGAHRAAADQRGSAAASGGGAAAIAWVRPAAVAVVRGGDRSWSGPF